MMLRTRVRTGLSSSTTLFADREQLMIYDLQNCTPRSLLPVW
jgi:hypothetical protein